MKFFLVKYTKVTKDQIMMEFTNLQNIQNAQMIFDFSIYEFLLFYILNCFQHINNN